MKRSILIGSCSGLLVLLFGGGGMFKTASLIKLSEETKQIGGYLFPSFE